MSAALKPLFYICCLCCIGCGWQVHNAFVLFSVTFLCGVMFDMLMEDE